MDEFKTPDSTAVNQAAINTVTQTAPADDKAYFPPCKIGAMVSRPREGPLEALDCIYRALAEYAIPFVPYGGAFWDQGLQTGMENAIDAGVDIMVIFDYDSVFTPKEFEIIFQTFMQHPEIDALSPMQPQRETGLPMFNLPGAHALGSDKAVGTVKLKLGEPFQVETAHFGMTFIRAQKLRNMPKPWFLAIPARDGSWRKESSDDVRTDSDIYFWRKWAAYGNNCFIHSGVSLGHLERLVSKFVIREENGTAIGETTHFYLGDWMRLNMQATPVKTYKPKQLPAGQYFDDWFGHVPGLRAKPLAAVPQEPAKRNYDHYDARAVFDPSLDEHPATDAYSRLFIQAGNAEGTNLGAPSKDLTGSKYSNCDTCDIKSIPCSRRKILVTFGGARYDQATQIMLDENIKVTIGANGEALERSPTGLNAKIVYDDVWLLAQKEYWTPERQALYDDPKMRGLGWFAWKPYIILDALKKCEKGDTVLYLDGDSFPTGNLETLFETCEREDGIMLFAACGFRQRHWCKRDCNILMSMDADRWRDKQAGVARFMLFQKGAECWRGDRRITTESFLEEWLQYASDPRCTTFAESVIEPEYPDLQQHRCEQAILTNLAHKYNIPLHREADDSGNCCLKGVSHEV